MDAQQQAKQLDSVTDRVTETELDSSKAQQAMSALSTSKTSDAADESLAAVNVSKEDIATIVEEMEVTEEVAEKVLRRVGVSMDEGKMLEEALRYLVTSS